MTVSFDAKADASKNIAIEFVQYFGTGGSPSGAVNAIGAQLVALTTSWQRKSITISIPSISGKTIGSNGDDSLQLVFWFDAGSSFNARTGALGQQSGTFDIANVQIEEGSVATPFEQRPLGLELGLCQRYYESSSYLIGFGGGYHCGMWAVATGGSFGVRFITSKRAFPATVTVHAAASGNAGYVRDDTASTEVAVLGTYGYGSSGFMFTTGAAAAAGNRCLYHYTADAEL